MAPLFSRLIRFVAKDGRTYHGDAILPLGVTDLAKATQARIVTGDVLGKHDVTDRVAEVRQLLAPLAAERVRTVRCLGLNYMDHARESGMAPPSFPILFYKPSTALGGPRDPIPVPSVAQESPASLDYECELVVVIGSPCSDVSEEDALDHVLGYSVGNDVSHREWQLRRGGGQWSLGKGFDGWAPWGPGIVAAGAGVDPQALRVWTRLNGDTVQDGSTSQMIFSVRRAVSFLSQGTTLMPGDLLFTGTPPGVGMGKTPPVWLKHGDVVEVGIDGIGSCINKVDFARWGAAKM